MWADMTALAYSAGHEQRSGVASPGGISRCVIHRLCHDINSNVRMSASLHAKVPIEDLWVLSTDADLSIRRNVALHHNASADLLSEIALNEKEDWLVRADAILNSNMSPETLNEIANLSDKRDGAMVLKRALPNAPRISIKTMCVLAISPDSLVRQAVALNAGVRGNSEIIELLSNDRVAHVRANVALTQGLPHDIALHLCHDKNVLVRCNVASRKDLPPDIINIMKNDQHIDVRRTLCEHGHIATRG